MKTVPFMKMAGAGNDFILIDNRAGVLKGELSRLAKKLCDRHRSIGADGLILLEKSKKADARMRIFNPDGSEAEMCGNGVRCLGEFAKARGIRKSPLLVETLAGAVEIQFKKDAVRVKLPDPRALELGLEIPVNGHHESLNFINTGVPHAVKIVGDVETCDVTGLGREIRRHAHFAPKGTNVNFIAARGRGAIEIRTYERGVEDETLACGTGSVASALVAAAVKGFSSPVSVHTRGGDVLKVYFDKKGDRFSNVVLEGPVETTFEGRFEL